MSERVSMPALGESVTEGTVTQWLKSVGDKVEVDEPLLEVSTDKVDTEIPSPVAGVLQEILAEADDTVEVGADLCVIGDGDAAGSDDSGSKDAGSDEGGDEQAGESLAEEPAVEEVSAEDSSSEDSAGSSEPSTSDDSGRGSSGDSSSGDGEGETVTMPALGESVTEGTVTQWLKSEGDQVEVDEPLLEVSTDKVDTEIPSPVAGVLSKILAQADETVEVGGALCVVGGSAGSGGSDSSSDTSDASSENDQAAAQAEEDQAAAEPEEPETAPEPEPSTEREPEPEPERTPEPDTATEDESAVGVGTKGGDNGSTSHKDTSATQDVSAYVTPLVRKLAAQHGVDLGTLEGTGVGGRIRKQDVLDAAKKAEEPAAAPADSAPAESAESGSSDGSSTSGAPSSLTSTANPESMAKRGTTEKMSRLRKVIATRMVESLQTSAQLTTVIEVDVTKIARLRQRSKDEFLRVEGTKLSFMPFFAMAAIEALKEHPIVNSSIEGDEIIYHASEHLGVAVDTPRGLLVPVIKDAGDLNIAGLARKIADLAERTRDNKVGPDELSGGSFTLTNTGSRGALFDTPIINQPNVGILGTGSVVKRPVVVTDEDGGETIAIRDMVYLALSYDHRVVDGADAARFLTSVKERLEDANFEV